MNKIILLVFALLLLGTGCSGSFGAQKNLPISNPVVPEPSPIQGLDLLHEPISQTLKRITKKPFGIYITKANSPVNPEKFSGYHTAVDFETLPGEESKDVPIFAACDGTLILKKYASGYGGVMVQSCKLDGNDVTIIYGHIKLFDVVLKVGDYVKAGKKIAVLGKGYSSETDGERKHLHFGIHKGTGINILGYTKNKAQLSQWLDPALYLSTAR